MFVQPQINVCEHLILYDKSRRPYTAKAHIKQVIRLGGSLELILPHQWAKRKVETGGEMVLVGNSELYIFPANLKHSEIKERKLLGNGAASQD